MSIHPTNGLPVDKISANDALALMIEAINQDKPSAMYDVAERYLSTLSKGGALHYKIKRIIDSRPRKMTLLSDLPRNVKGLVSQSTHNLEDSQAFLNQSISADIEELVFEWANADVYKAHNLNVRSKILLHGPTGNGKTTIAKHICALVELPFVEISSDTVIGSHLGSTGANIANIFKEIQSPCVLFWDEIDSIGHKRSVSSDSGATMENDRMVNSILVNMDKMHPGVILVGATNRYDALDSAFIRRFQKVIEVTPPGLPEKQAYADMLHTFYDIPYKHINMDLNTLNSYSEIKQNFIDGARRYVIQKIKSSI